MTVLSGELAALGSERRCQTSATAALTLALGAVQLAAARDIIVDASGGGEFTRIQPAVNAAQNGDVIIVRPGTYPNPFGIVGKELTIRSTAPQDPEVVAQTIIGGGTIIARHMAIENGACCTIEGLTFLRGRRVSGGGSTYVSDASAEFRHNVWVENQVTDGWGGAVYIYRSTVRFEHNTFRDNSSTMLGSGMRVTEGDVVLLGNLFENNITHVPPISHGNEYAAWIEDATVSVLRNTFIGEGMYLEPINADPTLVEGNRMRLSHGGRAIELQAPGTYVVRGNQVAGFGHGGGILPYTASLHGNTIGGGLQTGIGLGVANTVLENNLIAENGIGVYFTRRPGVTLDATFNCLHGNWEWDMYHYGVGPFMLPDNLYADPLVRQPGIWDHNGTPIPDDDTYVPGDTHLTRPSPCIDAGDPDLVWPEGARDIDGQVRTANGWADIGVDEYPALGDLDGDGDLTNFDIDAFVLALADPAAHAALYPLADGPLAGDINNDARFDLFDVDAFVALLAGG